MISVHTTSEKFKNATMTVVEEYSCRKWHYYHNTIVFETELRLQNVFHLANLSFWNSSGLKKFLKASFPWQTRCKGGSKILKWGVNFCNDAGEIKYYFNIWGIRKREKWAQKKGGENSPISPLLDPRLRWCNRRNIRLRCQISPA